MDSIRWWLVCRLHLVQIRHCLLDFQLVERLSYQPLARLRLFQSVQTLCRCPLHCFLRSINSNKKHLVTTKKLSCAHSTPNNNEFTSCDFLKGTLSFRNTNLHCPYLFQVHLFSFQCYATLCNSTKYFLLLLSCMWCKRCTIFHNFQITALNFNRKCTKQLVNHSNLTTVNSLASISLFNNRTV